MPHQFRLPDVGEGLTEAEIVAWHVEVGQSVSVNQLLLEIETAKSVVEIPCPVAGTVDRIHAQVGQTLPVGALLVTFAGTTDSTDRGVQRQLGEVSIDGAPSHGGPGAASTSEDRTVLVGTGPSQAAERRRVLPPRTSQPAGRRVQPPRTSQPAGRRDGTRGTPTVPTAPRDGSGTTPSRVTAATGATTDGAVLMNTIDASSSVSWLGSLSRRPRWQHGTVALTTLVAKAVAMAAREAGVDRDRGVDLVIETPYEEPIVVREAHRATLAEVHQASSPATTSAGASNAAPPRTSSDALEIALLSFCEASGSATALPDLPPGMRISVAVGMSADHATSASGAADRVPITFALRYAPSLITHREALTMLNTLGMLITDPATALGLPTKLSN